MEHPDESIKSNKVKNREATRYYKCKNQSKIMR